MRKIKNILFTLLISLLIISTSFVKIVSATTNFTLSGDLEGGVRITHTQTVDQIGWYRIMPTNTNFGDSKGIALRIKNNIVDGGGSPLHLAINETDSDRIMPRFNNGQVSFINLDGTSQDYNLRDFDNAIILPAGFDGYAYLPWTTFGFDSTAFGDSNFNHESIFAIYIGINTFYDSFSDYSLGDIEIVKNDNTTVKVLDLSTITELQLSSHFIKDYLGDAINFTRLSGAPGDEVDFDYTKVEVVGDLSLGVNVSYTAIENDDMGFLKITPTITDWSDSKAIAFRITNNTNITTPIEITIHEKSSEIFIFNKELNTIYFKSLSGDVSVNAFRAWDSRMVIPVSFNGYVIIPLDGFSLLGDVKDDGILNLDNIYAMFFGVSLKYDAFANYKLGDISLVKETETVLITDLETLDELAFNEVFVKDYNGDKITLERLGKEVKPAPAKRIGDVKILEDFDYQTSEEIKKEYPVWVGGSEVVNSLENGGMKVEIGGVIPGNNIYASIDIFPKAKVSDWTDWKDAKGVTFYVKNLSPREITINLEFEEMTTTESGEVFERWNIKYGAMIMLQDVSGAEFIVHAKPVFAIPIGFEGWVRIDFSQYWVPEWCTTGDLVLDLNSPITGFFLTTDTTVNEGLSYIIDNIGIYYNETAVSSLFYKPENSFTNNMNNN